MKNILLFLILFSIIHVCYSQINLGYIKKSNLESDPTFAIVGFFRTDCNYKNKIIMKGSLTYKHIVFYIIPRNGYYGALININGNDIEFRTRGKDNFKPNTDGGPADREKGYTLYDKYNNKIYYKYESHDKSKKEYGYSSIYLKIWYRNNILITRLCDTYVGD